jgi:hypothetical protein
MALPGDLYFIIIMDHNGGPQNANTKSLPVRLYLAIIMDRYIGSQNVLIIALPRGL